MRLIDADKLKVYRCDDSASRATFDYIYADDVEDAPTIDLVRCGECKYFNLNEWDETICGVPIIVAHEICHKWGDGCKTNIYGFCFMGERRADDNKRRSV